MNSLKVQKKRRMEPARAKREAVDAQIAKAAGSQFFQHRDPLYHVYESFGTSFDTMGRKHAAELSWGSSPMGEGQQQKNGMPGGFFETISNRAHPLGELGQAVQAPYRSWGQDAGEAAQPGAGGDMTGLIGKFSEIAFQRGQMSASVIAGTGKMMLVSSLKRTIGQSEPKRLQQKGVEDTGAIVRDMPGESPSKLVFNRSFTDSAIGIVVDTLRGSKRTMDVLMELARGKGEKTGTIKGGVEADTLRKLYPFLDSSEETRLLVEYKQRLQASDDPDEKAILQNAIARTNALVAKKEQMRVAFATKLSLISDRATEALAEFEAPGFADEVFAAVFDETEDEGDGGEGSGDEGDGDGKLRTEDPPLEEWFEELSPDEEEATGDPGENPEQP